MFKIVTFQSDDYDKGNEIFKRATIEKQKKRYDEALDLLKESYKYFDKVGIVHSGIGKYTRYSDYLYLAGRKEEAWDWLNSLLQRFPSFKISIYHSMSKHMYKDKNLKETVYYGVMAYLETVHRDFLSIKNLKTKDKDIKGYYKEDYKKLTSKDSIKSELDGMKIKGLDIPNYETLLKFMIDQVKEIKEYNNEVASHHLKTKWLEL